MFKKHQTTIFGTIHLRHLPAPTSECSWTTTWWFEEKVPEFPKRDPGTFSGCDWGHFTSDVGARKCSFLRSVRRSVPAVHPNLRTPPASRLRAGGHGVVRRDIDHPTANIRPVRLADLMPGVDFRDQSIFPGSQRLYFKKLIRSS